MRRALRQLPPPEDRTAVWLAEAAAQCDDPRESHRPATACATGSGPPGSTGRSPDAHLLHMRLGQADERVRSQEQAPRNATDEMPIVPGCVLTRALSSESS